MMLGRARDELRPGRIVEKGLAVSCTLAFVLVLIAGTVTTSARQTEPRAAAPAATPIYFDIPAQPLATALEAFSAVSGYLCLS
jgi:hypothetical protein